MYDYNRTNTLDVFDDITKNPSIIPKIDRTVFDFDYVNNATGYIADDAISGKYGIHSNNSTHHYYDEARQPTSNPYNCTDVYQFEYGAYPTISSMIYTSELRYRSFHNIIQWHPLTQRSRGDIYNEYRRLYSDHDEKCHPAGDHENVISYMMGSKHYPQRYYLRHNENALLKHRLEYIKEAFEHKLKYLTNVKYSHDRHAFLQTYIGKYGELVNTYERSISTTETLIESKLNDFQRAREQCPTHERLMYVYELMYNVQVDAASLLVKIRRHDANDDTYKYIFEYNDWCKQVAHSHQHSDKEDLQNVANDIKSMFSNLDIPHYNENPEFETIRNDIYTLSSKCRELESTVKPYINDLRTYLLDQGRFLSGDFDILTLYVKDIALKQYLAKVNDFFQRHINMDIYLTPEERIERANKERDEARSQAAEFQRQLAESNTRNQNIIDDLRRQLAEANARNTTSIDDFHRQLEEANTKTQNATALADTYHQNMIVLHKSLDEERLKNQNLLKKLESIQEIISQWTTLTSH